MNSLFEGKPELLKLAGLMYAFELLGLDVVSSEGGARQHIIKFTVPERVVIDKDEYKSVFGNDSNITEDCDDTCDLLAKHFKETLIQFWMEESCCNREEVTEFCKFYCKVRMGEIWGMEQVLAKKKEMETKMAQDREFKEI